MMRHYRENLSESTALAKQVLIETTKRRIRPNPINFTVWYEYLLKRDPHIMDLLEQAEDHEHEELAKDLFSHIISRLCFFSELENTVLKLVNEILGDIDGWEGNLDQHAEVLKTSLTELVGQSSDPEKAVHVVRDVIQCVQELTHGAEDIKHKMRDVRQEVAHLKSELERSYQEAHTDALTGAANRRAMDKFLAEYVPAGSTASSEDGFSCIILDIDHFKKINDQNGHLVGDSVLRFVARVLKNLTKGQDMVARFGGEEFIILLPNTVCRNAYALAEKIRKTFEKSALTIKDKEHKLRMTVSCGVSTYRAPEPIKDFLERADRALYLAKTSGRNRTIGEIELSNS